MIEVNRQGGGDFYVHYRGRTKSESEKYLPVLLQSKSLISII